MATMIPMTMTVLRSAVTQLPRPDSKPVAHVTVPIPRTAAEHAGEVPAVGELGSNVLDLEFERGAVTRPGGEEIPVWVFEGPVTLEQGISTLPHDRIAAWLRSQLGPRCLAADVENVVGTHASVRIAIALDARPAPP